ncbi:MAG: shikimate dehydrogenase [Actinomycetia bacterium]|nr:shikimate dehydrogenase [Actinomycetes bacterium]
MHERESTITASTGLVGVMGHPVGHSLSPRLHNAAFRAQDVDMVYLAFDVPPELLTDAFRGIRALAMRGVNITLPHKEAVLELVDDVDPPAARVGAVNTVVNDGRRLIGYNTDVAGFSEALRTVLPNGARGSRCVVAGAGGAARAVLAALVAEGATRVSVFNRTFERAVALCRAATTWGTTECEAVSETRLRAVAPSADVLVNATSVGLAAEVKDLPVPVDILHSGLAVIDLVYGKGPTRLVQVARAHGARAVDGIEMLLMQAGQAYRLWTGNEPPMDVMRASLEHEEG